jgi:hypothetical protein
MSSISHSFLGSAFDERHVCSMIVPSPVVHTVYNTLYRTKTLLFISVQISTELCTQSSNFLARYLLFIPFTFSQFVTNSTDVC